MEDIRKGGSITITHKLSKSGTGLVLRIPKDIIELLALDSNTMVEATIRTVERVIVMEKEPIKR